MILVTGNLEVLPFPEPHHGNIRRAKKKNSFYCCFNWDIYRRSQTNLMLIVIKFVRYSQTLVVIGLMSFLCLTAIGQTDGENLPVAEDNYIHRGDLIEVDIVGSSEFDWRGTLTPEGNLAGLDFTPQPIYAFCKTVEQVEISVAEAYSKLLREPKVKVTILDRSNRPLVTMFGAVRSEQRFQLKRPVLLNELIVLSGGFTDKSSGVIEIFRPTDQSCKSHIEFESNNAESKERFIQASKTGNSSSANYLVTDLLNGKQNPQIFSGDVVTVLTARPIYIIGGVENPKSYSSRNQMTLSRAVSSAGGFSKGAETNNITIFRRNGLLTNILEINFDKIKSGSEEDILLQDYDIIEVGVKGRRRSKSTPIIDNIDLGQKKLENLPLRIVD